jgi:sporulation protein YabP
LDEKKKINSQAAPNTPHQFTLVGREHLALDGAVNVVSFSPEEILLETTGGALIIKGDGLHIQQLNLDEGRMVVDGAFVSLAYAGEGFGKKSKHILGRLLR